MIGVILWSIIALGAAAGAWRGVASWGQGSALEGAVNPSLTERWVMGGIVGGMSGAAAGLIVGLFVSVLVGPPA